MTTHKPGFACVAVDVENERLRRRVQRLEARLARVLDILQRPEAHVPRNQGGPFWPTRSQAGSGKRRTR